MTLKYLVTGATGGLGSSVLSHLAASVPSSEYAAASSRETNRKQFEDQGIAFRVVDYDDSKGMEAAFEGVENLFFVSSPTFDVPKREKQHQNFIDAAKKQNVKHVCESIGFTLYRITADSLRCGTLRLRLAAWAQIPKQTSSKLIY